MILWRSLTVLAAGAAMFAVSSVASAQDRGSVQGVVNDAAGQPVTGAFVKLKNDERRLTFMVISRVQGQFEAKDLPPGTYKVQGVGAGYESDWFDNVTVSTGQSSKVGLALTKQQGPMLAPAWPKRAPQDIVAKTSKDAKDLPDADLKKIGCPK